MTPAQPGRSGGRDELRREPFFMAQTREPLDLPYTDEFGDLARLLR